MGDRQWTSFWRLLAIIFAALCLLAFIAQSLPAASLAGTASEADPELLPLLGHWIVNSDSGETATMAPLSDPTAPVPVIWNGVAATVAVTHSAGWKGVAAVAPPEYKVYATQEAGIMIWMLWDDGSPWSAIVNGERAVHTAYLQPEGFVLEFQQGGIWWRSDLEKEVMGRQERRRELACSLEHLAAGKPGDSCAKEFCNCKPRPAGRGMWRWLSCSLKAGLGLLAALCLLGRADDGVVTGGALGSKDAVLAGAGRMDCIDTLRLLAALHIYALHYRQDNFSQWGYVQVPFFFQLSGFVMMLERLRKDAGGYHRVSTVATAADVDELESPSAPPVDERYLALRDWLKRMFHRAMRLWPTHVCAMLITLCVRPDFLGNAIVGCPFPTTTTQSFLVCLTLAHAWLPCGGAGVPFNPPSWFISALFCFHLLFDVLYPLLRRIPPHRLPLAMATCALCGSWGTAVMCFYGLNIWNVYDDDAMTFRIFQMAHPAGFVPSFIAGMLAALWLDKCCDRVPVWAPGAVTGALLAKGVLFVSFRPWRFYLYWEHGLLGGLDFLLLVGCALARDPLAQRLATWPLPQLGRSLAFGMFMFQQPCYFVSLKFGQTFPQASAAIGGYTQHLAMLVGASLLCHRCVEQPVGRWLRGQKSTRQARAE